MGWFKYTNFFLKVLKNVKVNNFHLPLWEYLVSKLIFNSFNHSINLKTLVCNLISIWENIHARNSKVFKEKKLLELISMSLIQGSFIKAYLYVTFYKCTIQSNVFHQTVYLKNCSSTGNLGWQHVNTNFWWCYSSVDRQTATCSSINFECE